MRLTALLFLSVWLVVIDASSDASTAFLEANKAKPGVVTLPSGLQYKVLTSGDGTDHPTVRSPCICHYKGTLIDGTQFDSSYDRGRPATFAPNQVIKGWTEAMQMMVEGDKWELYIPSDLAYGKHGRPPKIPGGAALVFTMEIVKINGPRVPKKERTEDRKAQGVGGIAGLPPIHRMGEGQAVQEVGKDGGQPKGALEGKGTSEAATEAVGQAVGGGCQSGWGRLLS
eukprot:CAMPEP_0174285768 /NCGR_PEP_ID=MMETSP0809-20121228/9707_1 /TAXON_ID=73025 ORGANISM="Eutreptiella gymnastica-like, Strain CCMP1594" /NCGR_SAMPLE_ID=MMETSP0809 /ASSEMBLY_ACC=CAM_ASM_000658 /LENGTH=226 /DNA_ID=CAMNT_0015381625 /DNA_START=34 /DNA_END=712 /DNA_ORIENTATION=+